MGVGSSRNRWQWKCWRTCKKKGQREHKNHRNQIWSHKKYNLRFHQWLYSEKTKIIRWPSQKQVNAEAFVERQCSIRTEEQFSVNGNQFKTIERMTGHVPVKEDLNRIGVYNYLCLLCWICHKKPKTAKTVQLQNIEL